MVINHLLQRKRDRRDHLECKEKNPIHSNSKHKKDLLEFKETEEAEVKGHSVEIKKESSIMEARVKLLEMKMNKKIEALIEFSEEEAEAAQDQEVKIETSRIKWNTRIDIRDHSIMISKEITQDSTTIMISLEGEEVASEDSKEVQDLSEAAHQEEEEMLD